MPHVVTMPTEWRARHAGTFVALAASALVLTAPLRAEDWTGFRGQGHQAAGTASSSPVRWSATENVRWKVPIAGAGHSSPVISGQHVYLTTGYESRSAQRTLTFARALRVGLALGAFLLWIALPPTRLWWQDTVGGLAVGLFVLLALADEQVLQFARSPGRAWLGTAFAATVGLFACAYRLRHGSPARRVLALGLAVTAVLVIAAMPGGFSQTRTLAAGMAVVASAAVIGCLLVLRGVFTPGSNGRSPAPLTAAAVVTAGALALMPVLGRSIPLTAAGIAVAGLITRRVLGVRTALQPAWRICMLATVAAGVLTAQVLTPRSGWVYAVVCIDRASGRVVWVQEGLRAPRTVVHRANSQATPTAVTDGERVFAYYGTPGLLAVNAAGSLLWTNARVPFETIYGVGASPILAPHVLLVSGFTSAAPYLAAFDPASGRERWRAARPAVHPEFGDSRTPLVVRIDDRPVAVIWGTDELAGYDVATGKQLWRYTHGANHRMGSMVTSIVADGDRLFLPLENGMIALSGARLAAGEDPVLWTSRGGGSALTTPVLYGGRIFAVSGSGVATAVDAATGELLWRARLEGEYHSSPIAVAGKIYFTNEAGRTTVVAAAAKYEVVEQNDLGEPIVATLAPVDGDLYVRGRYHLYRIGPS